MQTPVCFSMYFVNKQNVRSYGNIIKLKAPQSNLRDWIESLILENDDRSKVCLSEELGHIMVEAMANLKQHSRQDFRQFFQDITIKPALHPVEKSLIFSACWEALIVIFPRKLFGSNHNLKVFRSVVEIVVYSARRQHILLEPYILKWDCTNSPWLMTKESHSQLMVLFIIKWIIRYVLCAMISLNFYVTTCKIDSEGENKLHYFWKHQWQSFYDKKVSDLIHAKAINKCHKLCLGKKSKVKHSKDNQARLKLLIKETPKLHLILKPNNDYRPIVRYKSSQSPAEKQTIKDRLFFLKLMTGKSRKIIESRYYDYYKSWLLLGKPNLYFVKADLSNAFGMVDREMLVKILSERYNCFLGVQNSPFIQRRTAQQYKDTMAELKKPLLVRAGSTVFEWTQGLVQGYKYSPALSELYYSHMDHLYFSQHFSQRGVRRLCTRVVDDYLYITDSLDDAHQFLQALSNYRNVNYEKTVVNFQHPHIAYSSVITFLGYSYDTKTLQVSRAPRVYAGPMWYKIAFTAAISDKLKFLDNRISQSNIQISSHLFNLFYNTEQSVWQQIFVTFCMSANRFCTILAILCEERDMLNYLSVYKRTVVIKLSVTILGTLLKFKPADFIFFYCINHFHHVAWKALYLCARGTSKCSGLIPQINIEMSKTNCLFGKIKEHFSVLNKDGELSLKSDSNVCRRSDLRAIVKQFNKLPEGFECYNHKYTVNKTI